MKKQVMTASLRGLSSFVLVVVLVFVFVFVSIPSSRAQKKDFTLGADISQITEYEHQGLKWYNASGEQRECTALMKEYGMNAVRLRVWVDPKAHGGWCNKEDVLVKAQRAVRLGMDVMVDFHYSDWWCDPAKQPIPHAWEKMSYTQMKKALADYTIEILTYLKKNGVKPRWVQIGNETSNGLLWSVKMGADGWEEKDADGNTTITQSMGHVKRNPQQYAGFIRAGYDAAHKVLPDVICIVHLDNGWDQNLYDSNLGILRKYGAKWDMIGMSLYPYWTLMNKEFMAHHQGDAATLSGIIITDCINNINHCWQKWHTPSMIVETGMEVNEEKPEVMEEGYRELKRIISEAETKTGGHCKGVFYWEPECLPTPYKLGAFHANGHPTRIMDAFKESVK